MGKRDSYAMVPEDDPGWVRFWNAYEKRSSKKDARKAWAKLNPSPQLVDQMVAALAWQFQQPDWVKQDHMYAPLPATYLRGERWTDEQPGSQSSARADQYGHVPPCKTMQECTAKALSEARHAKAAAG